MRVSNPLANSYTKNQSDTKFLTIDIDGSQSGESNSINADTLGGKKASEYVLKSEIYPIGSIYISISPTNPSEYFGGTWERIQGKFLLACNDSSHIAGSEGGEETHKLTESELPNITGSFDVKSAGNAWGLIGTGNGVFKHSNPIAASTNSDKTGDTPRYATMSISFGGNQAHNNMPPYLSVYMWQRTA